MLPAAHWSDRFAKFLGRGLRKENPLHEFREERHLETDFPLEAPSVSAQATRGRVVAVTMLAIGIPLVIGAGLWAQWPSIASRFVGTPEPVRMAALSIVSRPAGAEVMIDGQSRGITPLTLQVAPGTHTLTVRSGAVERVMSVDAAPGADILRDLEIAADVTRSPATPAVATAPAPSAEAPANPAAGWLEISSPFEVQVVENGEVIGTSAAKRIMLPSGRHNLSIASRTYEFEESRRVDVAPGQTATVRVQPPAVTVNINARPWAEVILNGTSLGQTPIANATIPIGTHRLVFRHPELGERQQDVVITRRPGQRVSMDLTK